MKRILYFLILISLSLSTGANNNDLFKAANDAYKKAKYDTAIILYKSILKNKDIAPEVYFNLGNAYYKNKDIANAILNYERAHRLLPGDEEISFNLQLAQTMVVDKINVLPEFFVKKWWHSFSEIFSSDYWAYLSISLFIAFLIFLGAYLFTNSLIVKKVSFYLSVLILLGSAISFSHSYRIMNVAENRTEAIVMSPTVTIKSSPDDNGTDLFVIHEGVKVSVIDEVGEWLKIKIADGNNGWIKKNDIERI